VGGVSERADAEAGGIKNPFAKSFRGSWRQKTSRFSGRQRSSRGVVGTKALVGSVSVVGASSPIIARADDSGCPKVAEEGNAVGLRNSRRRHRTHARDTVACGSGRVLRSVLRPVLVNPHYAPLGKTAVVGRTRRHRGWESSRKREEPAPGSSRRTERGSPRITARKSGVMRKEKEGGRGHRPCEDTEPRFGCPHVDNAVAEVLRRRLTSNKLDFRAPKRAAGSSERGSSSKRTAVGETIVG